MIQFMPVTQGGENVALTIVPKDVEAKREELSMPLKRLKWCVEFAYIDLASLPTYEVMAWIIGLCVFEPGMGLWLARGWNSVHKRERVEALQSRLRRALESIVEASGDVLLFEAPVKLTWITLSNAKVSPGAAVLVNANVSGSVEADWKGEQMMFALGMLLQDFPDRIRQCQAPRTKRMKHNRPECGVIFVGRPQQVYCTQVCAVRAWRVEHDAQAAEATEAAQATG